MEIKNRSRSLKTYDVMLKPDECHRGDVWLKDEITKWVNSHTKFYNPIMSIRKLYQRPHIEVVHVNGEKKLFIIYRTYATNLVKVDSKNKYVVK